MGIKFTCCILQSSECSSLSMRSRLSYELGKDASEQLHVRVTANSGKGYVNPAWVSLSAIEKLISERDHFTRAAVLELFRGSSINGAGFVLAVLREEGVIAPVEAVRHAYRYLGSDSLRERLISVAANDPTVPDGPMVAQAKRRKTSI